MPLRQVNAEGWLLEFLQRQCTGLTGHPAASGYPFGEPFWGRQADQASQQKAIPGLVAL